MEKTNVIKLKYLRAGQPSGREYTFYTPAPVEIGDIVDIAVVSLDNTSQGMVTAVNVPLEEIEAFKDRAKTIIGKAAPKAEAEEPEQKTLLDKNLLEHDLHDISECVDEIQKEKEQVEKERDAVIKKTEVLEKRFSALNSKAGLVDSHAREYGYYPEEWLPEAGTLESAKSYRKRIFPLVKKVANMIQALYSKYLELKSKNQKLSDRNLDLENRVDRLREEVSVIKKENVALLNVSYDMDRVVAVLGKNKVKEAIEVAKHLEQANAKQNIKKKRIDRDGR